MYIDVTRIATVVTFILRRNKMSSLLEKTRRLNKILQESGNTPVSFSELSGTLSDILEANVYVLNMRGKILGYHLIDEADSSVIIDEETDEKMFPKASNDALLTVGETVYNITGDELVNIFKDEEASASKYVTIVPMSGNGERLGTLVLARYNNTYNEEDLVLAEYSATVVSMEILRSKSEEMEIEARKKSVVQMAIGTLSYSELEAIEHIFAELNGTEGLLVASKIADRVGITRSVIVNALRKFESAGVIESRSLGMKGTHIRILNDKLIEELEKVKK